MLTTTVVFFHCVPCKKCSSCPWTYGLPLQELHQHGFMPKGSTITGYRTAVIYRDLSAAFDMINYNIAVAKLERHGFCGSLLHWFRSNFCGRSLCFKLMIRCLLRSLHIPEYHRLAIWVIWCSDISLLYFNDINFLLDSRRLSLVDDMKIYLHIKTVSDVLALQKDLETVQT